MSVSQLRRVTVAEITEGHPRPTQVVHRPHHTLVDAGTAALVGQFPRAFHAQHRRDVTDTGQFGDLVLGEERAVAEHQEIGVAVGTCEVEQLRI